MSSEKPNEQYVNVEKNKEAAKSTIMEDGMVVSKIYVQYTGETIDLQHIKKGTYNSNDGVIVCNVKDVILALPDNDLTMELITAAELERDSSIGVPHLNNPEYFWGESAEERERNSIFREWRSIHQKYSR